MRHILAVLSFCALASAAAAEVVDAQADGFSVREKATIAASPAKVWAALIKPALWWAPEHTYSNDPRNLRLDPVAGGAWIEALPSGGSVRHMVVVYIDPPSTLRMEGALGPMQAYGAAGHLTFRLQGAGGATDVTLTYDIGGHSVGEKSGLAPVVDRVLAEQLVRLKTAVETAKAP